jgi:hypothetical protein
VEGEVPTVEAHGFVAVAGVPDPTADLHRLEEAPNALVERHAERVELGLHPAGAHAQDDPTLRDAVDRGCGVGEEQRVSEGRQQDRRADGDASRSRGHPCQERERLEAWPRERGVAGPHRVEAEILGSCGELQQRFDLRAAGHRGLPRRQHHAQLHVLSHAVAR